MPMGLALGLFELVVMVLSLSLHDCAQAWMANRLGDATARMMGRLTMNPAQHFDPLGMLLFPLYYLYRNPPFVLGWSKPVPMTSRNFRRPQRDENVALLAGPAAQMGVAVLAAAALIVLKHVSAAADASLGTAAVLALHPGSDVSTAELPGIFPVMLLLYFTVLVNLLLFVFNMVPFPFFDGGKVLMNYLPYNAAQTYQKMGMYFMFAFFFFGFSIIIAVFAPLMTVFNRLMFTL